MTNGIPTPETDAELVARMHFPEIIAAAREAMDQFSTDEMVAMIFVMVSNVHGHVETIRPAVERVTRDVQQGGLAGLMGGMFRASSGS